MTSTFYIKRGQITNTRTPTTPLANPIVRIQGQTRPITVYPTGPNIYIALDNHVLLHNLDKLNGSNYFVLVQLATGPPKLP